MSVLSDCQIEQFHHDGFLLVEDVLDPEMDIQPVIDEYFELLDLLCNKWYAEGRIDSTYRELPFGDRLARVVTESDRAYHQYFDITLPQKDVGADTPMHLGKAVFDFLRNPRLLDVVEHFVGSEIYSNPVQHVRIKVPERLVPAEHRNGITAQTGWHQDQGVVLPEADDTSMVSAWVPMFDTDADNGCLAMVPKSHFTGMVAHCQDPIKKQGNRIPDRLIRLEDAVPVPMKAGSVLIFTRTTMHQSYPNVSDRIRWSFDIRYQPTGQPTGRPMFPGFVARSRENPGAELRDHAVWADLWRRARAELAKTSSPKFTRWNTALPVCG